MQNAKQLNTPREMVLAQRSKICFQGRLYNFEGFKISKASPDCSLMIMTNLTGTDVALEQQAGSCVERLGQIALPHEDV
jgi:hypothetical protein